MHNLVRREVVVAGGSRGPQQCWWIPRPTRMSSTIGIVAEHSSGARDLISNAGGPYTLKSNVLALFGFQDLCFGLRLYELY